MDSVTALLTLRDNLRTNLRDPYLDAGAADRGGSTWIFYDEPMGPKYPQVEILKVTNPTTVMTIGSEYWEEEQVFANIWIKSKNGFKITVDGVTYMNAHLVEYYLGQIKELLKSEFNTLFDAGIKGYHHVNTTKIEYDDCNQMWQAAVTVRVRFFKQ